MQSNPEDEQIMEEELESEFTKKGGKVLELKKDGKPQRWLCAINDDTGEPFDPPGVNSKDVLREIDDGKWVGNNPNKDKLDEIKRWRYDWNDPDSKGIR